ncbi:MAG: HDOD domain-containing protein [Syntrophorhabdaceae bacterium]|nr:HDOD domain-containing protein [Syntrophorhabdaceae bacterium]
MEREEILKRLRKIDVLPTFPEVMAEVISVIEDPMSSAGDLARTMDPSMASEVLRLANTAYFGTRNFRKITSIEHAIAIVGLEQLSQIILHMPFLSMMGGEGGLDREKFVRHSMICGIASKVMSGTLHVGEEHAVYIGGLMHDIGAIIIYRYFNEEWKTISALVRNGGCAWTQAEEEVLSCDHGMIGACLLTMWNIPQSVTDGVMHHHSPRRAAENIWSAKLIDAGNRFAKKVDLSDNFASLDEFINNNRDFIPLVEQMGLKVSLAQELDLYEGVYALMKNARGLLSCTGEDKDDQGTDC